MCSGQMGAVMIVDDQGDYISGSGLGTDIPLSFSRYVVHTYLNGKRDNVEYGADSLEDTMAWIRGVMVDCPMGVFKGEIWDCLTYKLVFTAGNFKGSSNELLH
jgi:hypothetical protein